MQASSFSYHELNTNNTKTIQNQKFKAFHNSIPLSFAFVQQFVTTEGVFQGHKHPLIYHPKGNYLRNYLSHKII
jgi:hypothetical protein